ncbi:hypothetical protein [Undibacterium sp. CCC3.4]|uniref:hypothetical protein n=1 Tax=Undibacterium sp. CCC3.4 TaxID=3048609 RepID=UPI002B2317FE|nr:hypothetical protein [Undibacterium sp. CCC3.4]
MSRAQRIAGQRKTVVALHDAVQNGIGSGGVTDHSQPWAPQIAAALHPEGSSRSSTIRLASISAHSREKELMYTRSIYTTATIARQHALLRRVAELVNDRQGSRRQTVSGA